MIAERLLYLSRRDVAAAAVPMPEIIAAVEAAFREQAEGRTEMPPKPGIHTQPNAFLHAMPAYIPAQRAAGLKWVGGYPGNAALGLPYITGLFVLNDVDTGLPLAVMDCTWITAARTGAATAVAARRLARPESQCLGVLGCGVQGRSHVEALREVFTLRQVVAYDVQPQAAAEFASEVARRWGLDVQIAQQPRAAVQDCDLVVTAGPILRQPHATIQAGWLNPGAFASLVDFDSYWHAAALAEFDKFCTDDRSQFEYYRGEGYFQHTPAIHATVGELVVGRQPGRTNAAERTAACNLGIALEDVAVAPIVYRRALELGLGIWLPQ